MQLWCRVCNISCLLGGDPQEIRFLLGTNENFPCITPLCSGRLEKLKSGPISSNSHSVSIPIKNFYRAINGFGTGLGEPATLERITKLLTTKKIVKVAGEEVGQPERVIIDMLVLEDGTRMHFASSTKGACLYYIEEPSSCVEAIQHEP